MKRWICPQCGKGKMAPARMKAEDSRRFCFSCSEETGMLVRRTSPALEKARQKAEVKRKAAAQAKRAKEAQARARKRASERKARSVGHLDLQAELKRLCGYKVISTHLGKRVPPLRLKRARTAPQSDLEWHTSYDFHIAFKIGTASDAAHSAAWLCVALAHFGKDDNGRRMNTWDNEGARDLFCQLAEAAYKVPMMSERWTEDLGAKLVPRELHTLAGILADKLRANMEAVGTLRSPPMVTKGTEPQHRQFGVVTLGAALRAKVLTFLTDFDEYLDEFDARLPGLADRIKSGPRLTVQPEEIAALRVMLEEAVHEVGALPDVDTFTDWLTKLEQDTE